MAVVGIYIPTTGMVCFDVSDLFEILWIEVVVFESARRPLFVALSETVHIKVDVEVSCATFNFSVQAEFVMSQALQSGLL